jgi:hypothetical protein
MPWEIDEARDDEADDADWLLREDAPTNVQITNLEERTAAQRMAFPRAVGDECDPSGGIRFRFALLDDWYRAAARGKGRAAAARLTSATTPTPATSRPST